MTGFGDLFGDPLGGLGDLFKQPSKPNLPCTHLYGKDGKCHHCGEPKPVDKKPQPKQQMRSKRVNGVAYIHADDVASILEANNIQPRLVQALRNLNQEKE